MIKTWLFCAALWVVMPFHLLGRSMTFFGAVMLVLCIATFMFGSLIGGSGVQRQTAYPAAAPIDWTRADRVMIAVSLLASVLLLFEVVRGNYLDLGGTYLDRSDRAQALLSGNESSASTLFQASFLLYPVGFAYLVRAITFERKLNFLRVGGYGLLPPTLASLVMGGRSPLLYAAAIAFVAYRQRRLLFPVAPSGRRVNWLAVIAASLLGLILLNYFAQVFVIRAESGGGIEAAYDNAAINWGVTFEGPLADGMRLLLGEGNTFLVFIFGWYIVQGIPMSNVIFESYTGAPTWGTYGVDLITAVVRRLNGDVLADRFGELLQLNVYGFLPNAFGSAFIDFRYLAFFVILAWGWLAGFVWKRVGERADPRWLLLAPMVATGIVFSFMNTPLGFSNGLVCHIWVIAAFWLAAPAQPVLVAAPAG